MTTSGFETIQRLQQEIQEIKQARLAAEQRTTAIEEEILAEKQQRLAAEQKQLAPEQQVTAKEEERVAEEQQRLAAEQKQLAAEQRATAKDEETRDTTLPEYLDLCHEHFTKNIKVQSSKYKTTQGDTFTGSRNKQRPNKLKPWRDFLDIQTDTKDTLLSVYPNNSPAKVLPRVFSSRHAMEDRGKENRLLASEQDLHFFHGKDVEMPVTKVLKHLYGYNEICKAFDLAAEIHFQNNMNFGDGTEQGIEDVTQKLEDSNLQPSTPGNLPSTTSETTRPKPKPDHVCVQAITQDTSKELFVIEYNPPHKLPLDALRRTFDHNRDLPSLEEIAIRVETPTDPDELYTHHAEDAVASVIIQAISYMARCGTRYGYITTGQAFVFLYAPLEEELQTVYYHLAIPVEDAEKEDSDKDETSYRTAVGQVLMFTLLASRSPAISLQKRNEYIGQLKTWTKDNMAILSQIPEISRPKTPSPSPCSDERTEKNDPHEKATKKMRLRSYYQCNPGSDSTREDDPDDQDPPSRSNDESSATPTHKPTNVREKRGQRTRSLANAGPSSSGDQKRAFCTELCLQGLARCEPLDHCCPNVLEHCEKGHQGDRHQLDGEEFRRRLSDQLRQIRGEACEPLGMQGARRALFRVTLRSHGYTIVAKGTVPAFLKDLQHEAEVYRRLTSIQGIHIPVCLGGLDLKKPFYYGAGICIVHMMFLSWSGESLDTNQAFKDVDQQIWMPDLLRAIEAIHNAGVLHRDMRTPNVLWNEATHRIKVIDFERAEMTKTILTGSPITPTIAMRREEWEARMILANPCFW